MRGIPLAPTKIFPRAQRLTDLFSLIRKSDLAAIGHGLELLAAFPWFRLVPRHLGSAMIVWVVYEGRLLLARA